MLPTLSLVCHHIHIKDTRSLFKDDTQGLTKGRVDENEVRERQMSALWWASLIAT
jgi:hypothetical protein